MDCDSGIREKDIGESICCRRVGVDLELELYSTVIASTVTAKHNKLA